MNFSKNKFIVVVLALGLLLIAIFQRGFSANQPVNQVSQSNEVRIVSTNPPELMEKKEIVVVPTQTLEFTFSEALQNSPETRIELEPITEIKIELSEDRKTAKITPIKPYALGQGYTLFIRPNTKFDNKKEFGKTEDFHFSTISYKGV